MELHYCKELFSGRLGEELGPGDQRSPDPYLPRREPEKEG